MTTSAPPTQQSWSWERAFGLAVKIFTILIVIAAVANIGRQALDAPSLLVQQLLTGLSKGAILAIIALGYTLVYGIIELINFAHGDVFMLGAFASLTLIGLTGVNSSTPILTRIPILLAILLAVMTFTAFLNVSIEKIAYSRLRNAPRLAPLISAIGVSFILQGFGIMWGKIQWRYGDYGALAGLAVFVVLFGVGLWAIMRLMRQMQRSEQLSQIMRYALIALLVVINPILLWMNSGDVALAGLYLLVAALIAYKVWSSASAFRLMFALVTLVLLIRISFGGLSLVHQNFLNADNGALRTELDERNRRPIMGSTDVAPKNVPSSLIPTSNLLGDDAPIKISSMDLMVIFLSLALMGGLYTFVQRTKAGKAMRATAQDRDAALLMGIDVDRTISLAFLLGGALAGAAGMITAIYTTQVVFDLGFKAGLLSFTSAVLGGIGNVAGAMLGGFLIGLIQTLSDQYFATQWTNAIIFAILVLILVFRPSGLLGEDVGQKA